MASRVRWSLVTGDHRSQGSFVRELTVTADLASQPHESEERAGQADPGEHEQRPTPGVLRLLGDHRAGQPQHEERPRGGRDRTTFASRDVEHRGGRGRVGDGIPSPGRTADLGPASRTEPLLQDGGFDRGGGSHGATSVILRRFPVGVPPSVAKGGGASKAGSRVGTVDADGPGARGEADRQRRPATPIVPSSRPVVEVAVVGLSRALGAVLIAIGAVAYIATGAASVTALVPAFLGLPILILGLVAGAPQRQRGALIATLVLAAFGAVGTVMNVVELPALLAGDDVERPAAVVTSALTLVLCLVYLVAGIRWLRATPGTQEGPPGGS